MEATAPRFFLAARVQATQLDDPLCHPKSERCEGALSGGGRMLRSAGCMALVAMLVL
jgi:hypothetical protein